MFQSGPARVQHSMGPHAFRNGFFLSYLLRMGIDIHSFPVTLGVQAFPLLEDDERDARRQDGGQRHQPGDESAQAVGDDEAGNGSARRSRSPVDVPALDAHELKGPLEPLEQRIVQITLVPAFHRACRLADTEEQGQGLCRRNQEDAGADDHHDLLLHVLLLVVHGDVHADGSHDRHDSGDGVAQLHHDRNILGDFLGIAKY